MRRRISVALILTVVATLVLAGGVSLLLTVHQTREQTRHELVNEGQSLATTVRQEATDATDPARSLRTILLALKSPLRLDGESVVAVRANGVLYDPVTRSLKPTLPKGINASTLDPTALLQRKTVSGIDGSVVYAAVPYPATVLVRGVARDVLLVVVLTRQPPTGLGFAGPWFLLSAAVILIVAIIVADRLSRRFVRPIQAAQQVAGRIAAGDLNARVPEPPRTDRELAALTTSINEMADSLARARGAERQFLLSVSHDLRTPLTSIRGFAEAIEDGATNDSRQAAAVIASEAKRLQRLVQDLLALAQLESRRFSLDIGPTDLPGVAEATAAGFLPSADELGLTLQFNGSGPALVRADADRLAQVVANLVENALKYAAASVRVGVSLRGGQPVLWVDDDGPGIAAADLPQVFERLFASRGTPSRQVGSGLGLAIVAELVAAMGGAVRAESPLTATGGTRVVVTLQPWIV